MKRLITGAIILVALSTTLFAKGKDKSTLKEKVEKQQEVFVFFNVRDIYDRQDETRLQSSDMNAKTPIRSEMPQAFYTQEIQQGVVDNLNAGMQVSSFKMGDASTLVTTNNKKFQYVDFSKMPDGIVMIVDLSGNYTRTFASGRNYTHRMEIEANLFVFEVKGGVAKKMKVNMGMGAFLGRASSPSKESDKMEDVPFLEESFKPVDIHDEYVKTMTTNTQDFANRMFKKHEKQIAKRK
jgi:hypothetical protein